MNIPKFKRQFGTENSFKILPVLHPKPSIRKLALSKLAIVLTISFWFLYVMSIIVRQLIDEPLNYNFTVEAFSYTVVMSFLTLSALIYLITRLGAYQRIDKHVRVPHQILEKFFYENPQEISILIPSYKEEPEVIRKTIMSAALQEFPLKHIVLLIDDNPNITNKDDLEKLQKTKQIIQEIGLLLKIPYERFSKKFISFKRIKKINFTNIQKLADEYLWASKYLKNIANKFEIRDHVDVFFVENVLCELSKDFETINKALILSIKEKSLISHQRAILLFNRLLWIFNADISFFERKKYLTLSHEKNKAMNINSYISLMGGYYNILKEAEGEYLVKSAMNKYDIYIPDSKFLLTLDADSILLKDYCLRLVYFLEEPGNERVAVVQTPYSSYRGALSRIERIAGATTDIQHLLHLGLTNYGATFWVGANAVIRKAALEDIKEVSYEGGIEVVRYIQDRTVIEDTESSVDLVVKGWKLVNYPERMSYSATPPDFGSLIIQRRRWANGGLIILPKILQYIKEQKKKYNVYEKIEVLLRINYLISIAWSSIGLLLLLTFPFDSQLLSPLVLFTALPYFIAMASDLKYSGYKVLDIFSIYGFNLMLLPVSLAGVFKSIEQLLTGRKISFARTPKVKNRTSAELIFIVSPILIILYSIYIFDLNLDKGNWGNAAFAGFNAITCLFAILSYIGVFNMVEDFILGIVNLFYVDSYDKNNNSKLEKNKKLDWRAFLYHGDLEDQKSINSIKNIKIREITIDE